MRRCILERIASAIWVLERPRLSRLRPSLRVRRRCVGERPFTITCAIFIGGAPICNRGKPSAHPDEPPVDEGQSVSSAPPAVVWLTRTPPNSRREIWCTTVLWAVDQEKRVGDGRRTNETGRSEEHTSELQSLRH